MVMVMITSEAGIYQRFWYPGIYSFPVKQEQLSNRVNENLIQTGWDQYLISKSSVVMNIIKFLERAKSLGVIIPRSNMVTNYLETHTQIISALETILQMVLKNLRSADQFILDLYQDQELDDEFLIIYARQKNYLSDFMEQIEYIREKYQNHFSNIEDIFLTTDFQNPLEYV